MNNTHQLTMAWISYSHDFRDCLVLNDNNDNDANTRERVGASANGLVRDDRQHQLHAAGVPEIRPVGPLLRPRMAVLQVPADTFLASDQVRAHFPESVRSAPWTLGRAEGEKWSGLGYTIALKKMTDLANPAPSMTWVLGTSIRIASTTPCFTSMRSIRAPLEASMVPLLASTHNMVAGSALPMGIRKLINGPMTRIGSGPSPKKGATLKPSIHYTWLAQRTPGYREWIKKLAVSEGCRSSTLGAV